MKKSKNLPIIFALIYIIMLFITVFSRHQWSAFMLSILALIGISVPFIISYVAAEKGISLPPHFIITMLLFSFGAQYLGELYRYYERFPWWDLFLHGFFGFYGVIIGVFVTNNLIKRESFITMERFLIFKVIFAFAFTMTLGVLWELFEFAGDFILRTNMTGGDLMDTSTDLIIKGSIALITSLIYYFHLKKVSIITN